MSESRFQHLLQPIRDLSKNWNIDLAHELEEYLEELEHLTIAYDPNDTISYSQDSVLNTSTQTTNTSTLQVMNFAEAALLIQGTSTIYSRKVEHLHALVYQTLAHLSKQNEDSSLLENNGQKRLRIDNNKNENDSHNAEVQYSSWNDPLPLIDNLKQAKTRHITLPKQNIEDQDPAISMTVSKTNNNIQASIALMGSLVSDDMDYSDTFKLMSCNLHSSGVMLLDEISKYYLQPEHTSNAQVRRRLSHLEPAQGILDPLDDSRNTDLSGMDTDGPGNEDEDTEDDAVEFGDFTDHIDDVSRGANLDMIMALGQNSASAEGTVAEEIPAHKNEFEQNIRVNGVNNRLDTINEDDEDTPSQFEYNHEVDEVEQAMGLESNAHKVDHDDPWAPLNPYETQNSGDSHRPFRKGKSFSKHHIVAIEKKLKGNTTNYRKSTILSRSLASLDDPEFIQYMSQPKYSSWVWNSLPSSNNLKQIAENNSKDYTNIVMEKIASKNFLRSTRLMHTGACDATWHLERKWKQAMTKKLRNPSTTSSAELMLAKEDEQNAKDIENAQNLTNLDVMDTMIQSGSIDTSLQYENDGEADSENEDDDYNAIDFDNGIDDWGPESVSLNNNITQDYRKDPGYRSYEDICRDHLATFMEGTESYKRETALGKQVNAWQMKLTPLLEQQNAHPHFDIQEYGKSIISNLQSSKNDNPVPTEATQTFDDVVAGMPSYEVCRMFLASLQLANMENVQLVHGQTTEEQLSAPFRIHLLSNKDVYEPIQNQALYVHGVDS